MQNKFIVNLIIANILWSLIPIVVSGLLNEISIITIIFIRLTISGIILFLLAVSLIFVNNKFLNNQKISFKAILKGLFRKNRRFYKIKNIYYYMLMGFIGIILTIIFFFISLKLTSIAFTIVGFLLSMVFIAFYEHEVNAEKYDIFKVMYMILLIFSIGIIYYISSQTIFQNNFLLSIKGTSYVFLFSLSITFFTIALNRDSYSKYEIKIISKNKYYKFPRLLFKMSICFLSGIVLMIPFLFVLYFLPFQIDLTYEIRLFFEQIPNLLVIIFRWEIQFLIFLSTIIPYLLIFTSQIYWSSLSLTYSQWSSIVKLIDPLFSLIFAVFVLNEFFPIEFLIIVIFLLFISILLRYSHESKNLIRAILLLKYKRGFMKSLPLKLLKYYGIVNVIFLTGMYDFLLNVKINSIKDFYILVNQKLKPMKEIKKVSIVFIDKYFKIKI